MSRLLVIAAVLSLAGCGFHLQGALTTPPEMQRTYIAAADRYSDFYRAFRSALPTEYEVFYTIEYALDAGTASLLERQTLTLTRDYTYDPTLVLGKAKEEAQLRDAIVRDLVRIVLRQISTL